MFRTDQVPALPADSISVPTVAGLWRALDEACGKHEVEWIWVKGHSGHEGNERADALARTGMPGRR